MYLGIYLYIKKEQQQNKQAKKTTTNKTKTRSKKERKMLSRTRTRHPRLVAILPSHYTTEANYIFDLMSFAWIIRRQTPCKDDRAALTELLTVKKKNKTKHCKGISWQ